MTVSDASPLIALARIGAFSLLEPLLTPLHVPPAVHADIMRGEGRPGDPEVRAAIAAGWMILSTPKTLIAPPYGRMRQGEIEAISLALELNAEVLIDEGPGRSRAVTEGVPWVGTFDVLLQAKREGLIPLVKPHLDALRAENFYLDAALYRLVLQKAGELLQP
ncbi:MAG: DUF3368 domain-containing protein [Armatimonadetes bacterium]|nr:DUF3368 domain-containing protein [Armatimonadota bacterium]